MMGGPCLPVRHCDAQQTRAEATVQSSKTLPLYDIAHGLHDRLWNPISIQVHRDHDRTYFVFSLGLDRSAC